MHSAKTTEFRFVMEYYLYWSANLVGSGVCIGAGLGCRIPLRGGRRSSLLEGSKLRLPHRQGHPSQMVSHISIASTDVQRAKIMGTCTYFSSNFTTSVIIRIIKSKAKIFKFDVKLFLIKRDDFFRAIMNNFTFYATCWRSVNIGFAVY